MKSAAPGILAVAAIGLVLLIGGLFWVGVSVGPPRLADRESVPVEATPPAAAPAAPAPAQVPAAPAKVGAALTGRVLAAEDGQPLPSVRLEVAGSEVVATTDAAGAFRLEGIPKGPRALSVLPPDHLPLEVTLDLADGEEASRELYVATGALLEGRVLFQGKPVAGAKVSLGEDAKSSATDPDGRYLLRGVGAGSHELSVEARGFLRHEEHPTVEPGRARTVLDIELEESWTARGTVVSEGKPVAGARVAAEIEELFAEPSRGPVTAEDGSFTLRGIGSPYFERIFAWKEGRGAGESPPFEPEPTEALEGIVVEIPPPVPLPVRVIDDSRAPVADAAVRAVPVEISVVGPGAVPASRHGFPCLEARTDASGRASLDLPPGEWLLSAVRGEATSFRQRLQVPREETGDYAIPVFAKGDLEGRVTDAAGAPVADAWVGTWEREVEGTLTTRTDGEGRFSFRGLPRGERAVQADREGFVPATVHGARPGAEPVAIVLAAESIVAGRVLLGDGVTPCRAFTLRLFLEAKADGTPWEGGVWPFLEQAVSDAEGRFEIRGVEAGTLAVEAESGASLSPRLRGVKAEPGKRPPPLRLVLGHGGTVRGRVTGEAARPAAGAQVTLHGASPGQEEVDSDSWTVRDTLAGPDGAFEIRLLPAGKYVVRAEAEDHFPSEQAVHVEEGREVVLDVLLPRGSPFAAAAVDGQGAAVPQAWIEFLDEEGEQRPTAFLEEGYVVMTCFAIDEMLEGIRIAPGAHRARLEADGFAPVEVRFTAKEGEPVTLKAVLKPE